LLADQTTAIYAAALTQSILYFTFLSPEFNPNTLQLLLWALAGYAFSKALVLESTRAWIALGLIFAAGFYAKYFMVVCGLSFALFLLLYQEFRQWYRRPQPYAAVLLCALLLLPHILWLHEYNYLPFRYAGSRLEHESGIVRSGLAALSFTGAQVAALLPAVLLGGLLLFRSRAQKIPHAALIRWLAFAPLVIVVIPSFLTGRGLRSMWGAPMLTFIPLWLVSSFRIDTAKVRSFAIAWAAVFALTLSGYAGNELFAGHLGFKPSRGQFPGRETAEYYLRAWNQRSHSPLIYVVGDEWEACNIAFYSPQRPRPHVWIYGTDSVSPWINEDEVLTHGAVIVWNADATKHPAWLDVFLSRFPGTILQEEHAFANGI